MKAIQLAKKLYPALSKKDIIEWTCPDIIQITNDTPECCNIIRCKFVNTNCNKCWDRNVSEVRCDYLLEAKAMCNIMGC